VIHADGSVFESGEITSEDNVIVVSEGTGATQRIRVRLPSNNLGTLVAVKVDLTGKGETPDKTSALFTPSQMDEQTVALAQPAADQMGYSFQITGYNALGQPIPGASGQSNDQVFIVQMPAG
jgi:hypothetical protein